MKITVICVGKLKEKYLKQGIQEYTKRLGSYANIDLLEVADEKAPENMSEAEQEEVKRKEGDKILSKISSDAYVISLEILGDMPTSEKFSKKLESLMVHGKSKMVFVIGGSLGLSKEVQERSDYALSFSKMTFPHQLMRVVLLEQIYRAFRIMKGEPYHK
ncbi:23S rRNA (pseudouridine(1915)-N(3))-methyltransferase RlmH [Gracilibacillus sp. YIM 98692]|uniref:23S rRNA (pseudouridine(1915)-N(3))-methyltransferase RlmH n=1 Tax=Gracilibacillus sp. YIM 98692 TaxID=2663532 RepID=UPI0013D4C60E|nr:23S rRNA (pseudouridine(1915)-N(3))-methyltransferase RlmH [Gracilibacillus sp. YIM 98692]